MGYDTASTFTFIPILAGEDSVEAGSSLVFSCLEVCLSIMVRHLPSINTSLVTSAIYQTHQRAGDSQEVHAILEACLTVLAELPALCSDRGNAHRCH